MKRVIFALILTGTFQSLVAQISAEDDSTSKPLDVVVVEKDDRVDLLMKKKIVAKKATTVATKSGISKETAEKLKSTERVKVDRWGNVRMPGFRLQVMNSTDRAAVYAAKSRLYASYPTQRCYVVNQTPFFKLRFGNFTSKADAEKYRKALAPMFPSGVTVVNDIVEARVKISKEIEVPIRPTVENKSSTKTGSKTSTGTKTTTTTTKTSTKPKPAAKPKTAEKPKPAAKPKTNGN